MLQALPFEGTIKVRNKGVDVTLLPDKDTRNWFLQRPGFWWSVGLVQRF